jgi:hypothetical protein
VDPRKVVHVLAPNGVHPSLKPIVGSSFRVPMDCAEDRQESESGRSRRKGRAKLSRGSNFGNYKLDAVAEGRDAHGTHSYRHQT